MAKPSKKIKKPKNGTKSPPNGKKPEKKAKKSEPAQVAAGDVKFGSYIAKVHKALQNDPEHDQKRTITADSVTSIENMTDHMMDVFADNAKHVMRYTKATTFNLECAKATVNLALAGALKTAAMKEGQEAVDKYLATLPPPKPPAAADAAPETEPVG